MSSSIDNVECPICGSSALLGQPTRGKVHTWCTNCEYDSGKTGLSTGARATALLVKLRRMLNPCKEEEDGWFLCAENADLIEEIDEFLEEL